MDLVLSDELSDTGTLAVDTEAAVVRVSGTHIGIDVLTGAQVTVQGSLFFFRIKIEWNGGTANATVLDVSPGAIISNVSVYLQTAAPTYEWVIEYDNVNSITRDELTIRATPGNALQQVTFTGFTFGISRTNIGFITKNGSGTPVYPADGDVCWIEVGPGDP